MAIFVDKYIEMKLFTLLLVFNYSAYVFSQNVDIALQCSEWLKKVESKVNSNSITMESYSKGYFENCFDKNQKLETSISISTGTAPINNVKDLHRKNVGYFEESLENIKREAIDSKKVSSEKIKKLNNSYVEVSNKNIELQKKKREEVLKNDLDKKGFSVIAPVSDDKKSVGQDSAKVVKKSPQIGDDIRSIFEFSKKLLELGANKKVNSSLLPLHLLPDASIGGGSDLSISITPLNHSQYHLDKEKGVYLINDPNQAENKSYHQNIDQTVQYIKEYYKKHKDKLSKNEKVALAKLVKKLLGFQYARSQILSCIDNQRDLTKYTLNYLSIQDLDDECLDCSKNDELEILSDDGLLKSLKEISDKLEDDTFDSMRKLVYPESMKVALMSLIELNQRYSSSRAPKDASQIVAELCRQQFYGLKYKKSASAVSSSLGNRSKTVDVCEQKGLKKDLLSFANNYQKTIKEKKSLGEVAKTLDTKMKKANAYLLEARKVLREDTKYKNICKAIDESNGLSEEERKKLLEEASVDDSESDALKKAKKIYALYEKEYIALSNYRETSLLFTPVMMSNDKEKGFYDQGLRKLFPSKGAISYVMRKFENLQRRIGGDKENLDRELTLGCSDHKTIPREQVLRAHQQAKNALYEYVKGSPTEDIRGLNHHLYEDSEREGLLSMFEKNPAAMAEMLRKYPKYAKHICELNHQIAKKDRVKKETTNAFRALGVMSMFAGPLGWVARAGGATRAAHLVRMSGAFAGGVSGGYEGTLALGLKNEATSNQNQIQFASDKDIETKSVVKNYQDKLQEAQLAKAMQALDWSFISLDLFDAVDVAKSAGRLTKTLETINSHADVKKLYQSGDLSQNTLTQLSKLDVKDQSLVLEGLKNANRAQLEKVNKNCVVKIGAGNKCLKSLKEIRPSKYKSFEDNKKVFLAKVQGSGVSGEELDLLKAALKKKSDIFTDSRILNYLDGKIDFSNEKLFKIVFGDDFYLKSTIENLNIKDDVVRKAKIAEEFPGFSSKQVDSVMEAHKLEKISDKRRLLQQAGVSDTDSRKIIEKGLAGILIPGQSKKNSKDFQKIYGKNANASDVKKLLEKYKKNDDLYFNSSSHNIAHDSGNIEPLPMTSVLDNSKVELGLKKLPNGKNKAEGFFQKIKRKVSDFLLPKKGRLQSASVNDHRDRGISRLLGKYRKKFNSLFPSRRKHKGAGDRKPISTASGTENVKQKIISEGKA